MSFFNARDVKPGDAITAAYMNQIAAGVRASQTIRGGAGMAVRRGAGGIQVAAVAGDVPTRLGVAAANIAPRAGATFGVGVLNLVDSIDPATGAATSAGNLDVVNPSSSTFSAGVSIKAGQYCVAVLIAGAWVAFPLEC